MRDKKGMKANRQHVESVQSNTSQRLIPDQTIENPQNFPHQWTGRRKTMRPRHFKRSTHLVLRLKELLPSLFEPRDQKLRHLIYQLAQKYNIRIYRLVLNHSHLHAVTLLPNRQSYTFFIRELTAAVTQYFTKRLNVFGVQFRRIFKSRPFTRGTPWGRAYKILLQYMDKNEIESGRMQKTENELIRKTYEIRQIAKDSGLMCPCLPGLQETSS